jgi:RNA polymerase sigma factor (sigma-70 family)
MSCTPQPPHRPHHSRHPQRPHRPQRQSPPSCSQRSAAAQRRRCRDPLVPAPFAPSVSAWLAASLRQEPLAPATVLELSRRVQSWRNQPTGKDQCPCAMRRRALRARNQLACHNLRLVSHTWQRHRSLLPPQEEATADALQEAAIALLRAAELFDPSRGYRFSTYASFWVRRGFEEHERRQRRLVRLPSSWVETLRRVASLVNRYRGEHGELPSLAWVAERCGRRDTPLPVERLRELLITAQRLWPRELDRPLWDGHEDEGGQTLLDVVPDPRGADPTLAAALALEAGDCPELADFPDAPALLASCARDGQDEQRSMLPVLMRSLRPVERRLLWHLYLREHPLTARQLERVMGLSPTQQQALERTALQKLREAARASGMRIAL